MNVAFIAVVNLDDLSDLAGVTEDITDILSDSYEVISVHPWARPALQQQGVPTAVPTTTQQPTIIQPTIE